MQNQISSQCQKHVAQVRDGYTLIEILIVVSILAAVSALAVPALRGPLERTRLRSAARAVQSAIGKTRNAAIRTGRIHTIAYEPGTGRYRVDRAPEPTMPEFENAGAMSAIPDSVDELLNPTEAESQTAIESNLPTNVYFATMTLDPNQSELLDPLSEAALPYEQEAATSDLLVETGEQSQWSPPITFYPNGRTEDFTIRVATQSAFIDVSIRGLTGTASFSRPRRWSVSNENDVDESGAVDSTDRTGPSTTMGRP